MISRAWLLIARGGALVPLFVSALLPPYQGVAVQGVTEVDQQVGEMDLDCHCNRMDFDQLAKIDAPLKDEPKTDLQEQPLDALWLMVVCRCHNAISLQRNQKLPPDSLWMMVGSNTRLKLKIWWNILWLNLQHVCL